MMKRFWLFMLILITLVVQISSAGDKTFISGNTPDIIKQIQSLADARVSKIDLEIFFTQPIDHKNPEVGKFEQRIYLTHKDFAKPVVLWLEGYATRGSQKHEPTQFLDANQLVVEHRYFGNSKPDPLKWKFLTIKQSAADHHRIVEAFKPLYSGKWVSAGRSKGGQTAMYHRRFYPNDVDATICYVAPLNFSDEDPRIYSFLSSVGDEECRAKIERFQKLVLEKKEALLPLFQRFSAKNNYTYKMLGPEAAFEYTALEYSFSFWQWHKKDCKEIPDKNEALDIIFEHLVEIASPYYFSDKGISYLVPSFIQMLTELGYYGYDTTPFKELLTAVPNPDFTFNLPEGIEVEFNPEVMQDIHEWITTKGNNMIFIYGELDTWSASAVQLNGKTNALKMVLKDGDHRTYIRNFPNEKKEQIFSTLEDWLQLKIER